MHNKDVLAGYVLRQTLLTAHLLQKSSLTLPPRTMHEDQASNSHFRYR